MPAVIRQRQTPHLGGVFGRDGDLQQRLQGAVAAMNVCLVRGEQHVIFVRSRAVGWNPADQNSLVARFADVEELAPIVARAVFAPACDVAAVEAAEAAAGIGNEDVVVPVGKKCVRGAGVWGC